MKIDSTKLLKLLEQTQQSFAVDGAVNDQAVENFVKVVDIENFIKQLEEEAVDELTSRKLLAVVEQNNWFLVYQDNELISTEASKEEALAVARGMLVGC